LEAGREGKVRMYGKVFDSLFKGSMRGKTDPQLVFIYMLTNCDGAGQFNEMETGIADATGMSVERVIAAIAFLSAPDKRSRSPLHEGRRIVLIDEHRNWGWLIVNHAHYRAIANGETRRELERTRKAEYRASKQSCPGQVPDKSGPHAVCGVRSEIASGIQGGVEGEGAVPARMPADGWSWEHVWSVAQLRTVAVGESTARGYFDARTATAWVDAGGRPVARTRGGLESDLRRWKVREPSRQQTAHRFPESVTQLNARIAEARRELDRLPGYDEQRTAEQKAQAKALKARIAAWRAQIRGDAG